MESLRIVPTVTMESNDSENQLDRNDAQSLSQQEQHLEADDSRSSHRNEDQNDEDDNNSHRKEQTRKHSREVLPNNRASSLPTPPRQRSLSSLPSSSSSSPLSCWMRLHQGPWPPVRFMRWTVAPFRQSRGVFLVPMKIVSILQWMVLVALVILLIIRIGAWCQVRRANAEPTTTDFYRGDKVCGLLYNNYTTTTTLQQHDNDDNNNNNNNTVSSLATISTFNSSTSLSVHRSNSTNTAVLHCQDCGACSNPHDVGIYYDTRNTLLKTTTQCAKLALIWGRATSGPCMAKHVGFTPACHDCWVENIMCDIRQCLFVCLWDKMFGGGDGQSQEGRSILSPCTMCDEKRCGPDFIRCAGVNRRRAGILSDIQRNDDVEVCRETQEQWWEDPEIVTAFENAKVV